MSSDRTADQLNLLGELRELENLQYRCYFGSRVSFWNVWVLVGIRRGPIRTRGFAAGRAHPARRGFLRQLLPGADRRVPGDNVRQLDESDVQLLGRRRHSGFRGLLHLARAVRVVLPDQPDPRSDHAVVPVDPLQGAGGEAEEPAEEGRAEEEPHQPFEECPYQGSQEVVEHISGGGSKRRQQTATHSEAIREEETGAQV